MNFLELQEAVYEELEESSGSPVMWPREKVKRFLNEGYEEFSDASEWFERAENVDLLALRTYYDLRTALPFPVLTLRKAYNATSGVWFQPTTLRELDFHTFAQWERTQGQPCRLFTRGLFWLGMYPVESQDSGSFRLHHTAMPPRMVYDDDAPGFPDTWHQALVDYACSELFALDGETALALEYWRKYAAQEQDFVLHVKRRMEVDTHRELRGEGE